MRTIKLAGADIELWESGDGPPLLFLHGAGGFRGDHPFVECLGRHRRIIAPSHPGFGASALPDWMERPDDIAHLYLELMDRLGLDRIDLMGASFGGWIAAELATMSPRAINRLVLVAPAGVKLGSRDRLDIPDMFATPPAEIERLLYHQPEKFRPDPSRMSDAELAIMLRNRESFALFAWEPYLHNPKLPHRLHRVTCPALFIRGAHDGLISAAYMDGYAKLLPNTRSLTIPDAGHVPQLEQPEAFAEAVMAFLNEPAGGE